MLTKTDLKEIKKIVGSEVNTAVNSSEKRILRHVDKKIDSKIDGVSEKIDALAIATKNQFDVIESDIAEMKSDLRSIKRIQLSHETRLVNLEA